MVKVTAYLLALVLMDLMSLLSAQPVGKYKDLARHDRNSIGGGESGRQSRDRNSHREAKPSSAPGSIPEVTGTTMANILSETPSVLDGTLGRHVPEANAIPTAAVSFSGSIVDDSELERGAEEGVKDANLASLATPIKPKGSDDLVGTGATACAVASAAEREENTRDAIAISTAAPIQTSDLGGDMGDDIEHDDSYGSPVHTSSGSPLISSSPSATAKAPSKSPSLGSTNEIFSGRLGPGTPKDSLSGSGPASWASTAAPTSPESGISVADQPAKRIAAGIAVGKSGKATWYNPGLGSCSKTDSDSDLVVALASASMSGGKNCNRNIRITDPKTRKTAMARVRDTCLSCAAGDLDMSPLLFQKFQSLDVGTFNMKWNFE